MAALPPFDPGVEIVVASHGMSKGISQTEGPQAVPKAYLQLGNVQLGGQWKNVNSSSADGEGAAFIAFARKFGSLQLTAGAAFKFQTGVKAPTDSQSLELTAGASRKIGPVSLKLSAVYSPDDLGAAKRSLYLEGGPSLDIGKSLRLSANIGHRSRVNGPDYTSFNAGASYTMFKGVSADLRYYRTNRRELGDTYRQRLVASARLAF
jgi:hypothetical protein